MFNSKECSDIIIGNWVLQDYSNFDSTGNEFKWEGLQTGLGQASTCTRAKSGVAVDTSVGPA